MRVRVYTLEEMIKSGCFVYKGYVCYDYGKKIKTLDDLEKAAAECEESSDIEDFFYFSESHIIQLFKAENLDMLPVKPFNVGKKVFSLGQENPSFKYLEGVTCQVLRR